MKIAKLVEANKIEIFEEPKPAIGNSTDAVIKVKAVGICGTDMHIFAGHRADVVYPAIMGHELSGVVEKVGSEVKHISVGDHVVLDPVFACDECYICKSGHSNVCSQVKCFGVQMDGGFSEYVKVPAKKLYKVDFDTPYEYSAMLEPFSIAANILSRTGVNKEDNVLITGAGTIGLSIVQSLKTTGANVLVADIVDFKLNMAKQFGAAKVVNTKKESLDDAMADFAPMGADLVIDAVGVTPLTEMSMKYTAPCARVAVIGFDSKPMNIKPIDVTKKELTIVGSRMNKGKFPEVISWLKDNKIEPKEMITQSFDFDDIQKAFESAVNNSEKNIKTMIKL